MVPLRGSRRLARRGRVKRKNIPKAKIFKILGLAVLEREVLLNFFSQLTWAT